MSGAQQTILLERPRAVDVVSIERELGQLWKKATEEGTDGAGDPVVRACTLNLLVVTDATSRLQTIEELIGEVTRDHPARIFLIHAERVADRPVLDATIAVRCSLPVRGGRQVCCEQISITALGAEASKIPSVVASLLVPDIPSILLWKMGIEPGDPLFVGVNRLVDRVLIDSSDEPDPIPLLRQWVALTVAGQGEEFGDLAWSHVTPWRSAVARAFNPVDLRSHLQNIARVEMVYSTSNQPVHSGLSQTLLMFAWLMSRLQWSIVRPVHVDAMRRVSGDVKADGNRVELVVDHRSGDHPGLGGLEELCIVLRGGPSVTFSSCENRSCIRWQSDGRESALEGALWAHDRDESSVLARELEVLVHDDVYDAARSALAKLLGTADDVR